MPAPIPVHLQFSDLQKADIKARWDGGATQIELAADYSVPRRTMMKLCNYLGLTRTPKEVAAICELKSEHDTPENIQKIRELRNSHSLEELGVMIGCSATTIDRLCAKHEIILDQELYSLVQAERMKAAWTPEKRNALAGSIYQQLNDKEWLVEHYEKQDLSMGKIAEMVGAPISIVAHHLRKHGVATKPKEQYLSKLRRQSTKKRKIVTRFGELEVQSKAEEKFIESLPESVVSVKSEPYTLSYAGMQYVPDFEVDGRLVEIKPPEYAIKPGVDRQRFVKQRLIANHNKKDVDCWYYKGFQKSGGFYVAQPLGDEDRYFCLNWKLVFDGPDECFDFLVEYGFKPLKWNRDKLLLFLNNLFTAKDENRLNANHRNPGAIDFITHFNDHFWHSTHKNYNPISMAFEVGNRVILRDAIRTIWEAKNDVNIYRLVRLIGKKYKDFTPVGVFKPWVAQYVYETLLPNGGVIVDPCMGWGGRLMGTLDSKFDYVGYDFNPNVIIAHQKMRSFVGSRFTQRIEFSHADSSKVEWPSGDLIFTSPPYDDTESYHGLERQCVDTDPIYDNIMRFGGLVALNIPLRHRNRCVDMAKKHGRVLINELKMRTTNFIGRETTYEPILVFK